MIKLITFDLDGVLVDAKEIHYEALNKALVELGQKPISREDHISKFDGLNTLTKLKKLGLWNIDSQGYANNIMGLKQKYTSELIWGLRYENEIYNALECLKADDYTLCVASNSIRNTVRDALSVTGYMKFFDFYLSNEDVKYPKPSSEIYLQCMIKAGVSPKETLIIEDSYNGRLGAEQTGAYVMGVNSPKDVTYEKIMDFINHKKDTKMKWKDEKLNVLIPMSGLGSRFEETGKYSFPKPLIEVLGKPMIQLVTENLNIDANFIYLVRKEHYDKFNLKTLLNLISPGCKIVVVDKLTEGAACTSLLAKEYIDNDHPLLIANSDQFVEWDSSAFMYSMMGDHVDGGLATFKGSHPKWSFVELNPQGFVTKVEEKNPISDIATCGIYFWKKGEEYVKCAEQMINKNIRTNNEFYIAPVYNEKINEGGKIKIFNVEKMWGLGDPQSFDIFINKYQNGNQKM